MERNPPAPASKDYCVWADYVRRVYQHVTAASPQEAHRIAKDRDGWEFCDWHEHNCYRLSDEVQDLETEEFVRIEGAPAARTAYTPGPWKIGHAGIGHGRCRLIYSDYQRDEVTGARHHIADCIYNEANAHLIAAAPDLYDACRLAILSMREALSGSNPGWLDNMRADLDFVEQAIARADGATP